MKIDKAITFYNEKSKNIKLKAEPQTFIVNARCVEKCHISVEFYYFG